MMGKEWQENLIKMHGLISKIDERTKDLHNVIMGNGQPGLYTEFNQLKGGLSLAKFLAGGGILFSIVSLLIVLFL